jgi:hypothetical protein
MAVTGEAPRSRRQTIQGIVIISCILLAMYQIYEFKSFALTLSTTITSQNNNVNVRIPNGAFCIYIKSAPNSSQTRTCARETCEYRGHFFLIGQPSYGERRVQAHHQGLLASKKEVEVADNIIAESDEYRDILAVPYRDLGMDDSVKYLEALHHGVQHNCTYTIIGTDDMCVKLSRIRDMVARHYPTQHDGEEIYFEYNLISNNDTTTQSGFRGVSLRLASFIVQEDWTHSVLSTVFHRYGNRSHSPIMTKWVDYAKAAHNVPVHHVIENAPLRNTDSVCNETYEPKPINYAHDLCIVTLSGASMFDSRQCQRTRCRPRYGNVPHVFAVGIPSDAEIEDPAIDTIQNPTPNEVNISKRIIAEQEKYGDLLVTLHKDYYIDLPEKRMAVLHYGFEHKCAYTIKVDDEYCVDIPVVKKLIAKHEEENPNQDLYFGNYMFKGTEYKSMQGPHGEFRPYMSGHCNGASYGLSSYIVNQDWTHTVMRAHYGSSSEDVDMGFWVDYAIKRHNLQVKYVANRYIREEIPKDACNNVTSEI